MSYFYKPKRSRNLYHPNPEKPFKLSRSKIDLFLECPRCFYIDRKLGVGRPPSFPFHLNSAVDHLLKKEFDAYRAQKEPHPLMVKHQVPAIPYFHENLDTWRENFKGMQYPLANTNLVITGAIDDVWINKANQLIVVDYKATSKDGKVSIHAPWQISYKRQMEVYQWLLEKLGFDVSKQGYFVYCNALKEKGRFDQSLEFDIHLLGYRGNTSWIEPTLEKIYSCLNSDTIPESDQECDYFLYRDAMQEVENQALK